MFFGSTTTCWAVLRELRKYFNPFAVVMPEQDLKDELGPGGELSMTGWRCIHRMISAKEMKMYRRWLDRWRGVFDPCFVMVITSNLG